MKRNEFEYILEHLKTIAHVRGYKVDETEDYFEIYSSVNPFPSLMVWKDNIDSVTVKTRIDCDVFFEDQFDGFDNALTAFILIDKTTKAIAEQLHKSTKDLFGKLFASCR